MNRESEQYVDTSPHAPGDSGGHERRRFGLLLVLVGLVSVLPFSPALGGPFFWDDNDLIGENPYVRSLSHVGHWFTHDYFDSGNRLVSDHAVYFRPLVLATFSIDWGLGGGNPAIFHMTNLLLAALVTIMTAFAFARWTGSRTGALLAALVIAWHPTRAESVAWISGRTDVLVTLFILLVCQARAMRARWPRLSVALEIAATFGAYFCKETAIVLPAFVALEHWVGMRRPSLSSRSILQLLRSSLGHVVAAVGYLMARFHWAAAIAKVDANATPLSLTTRIGLVLETMGRAIQLAVWPVVQKAQHGLIAIDEHDKVRIDPAYAWCGAAAVALILLLMMTARRKRPLVTWGLALYLSAWLPVSNIVPTRLACVFFERFLFLPNLGLALAALGLASSVSWGKWQRIALATATAALLLLGFAKSYSRALDYVDPVRFWTHEARVNPLSTVAATGLVEPTRIASGSGRAVQLLQKCHQNALIRCQLVEATHCVFDAAVLMTDATLDLDEAALTALAGFFRTTAAPGQQRSATLDVHNASLSIDLSNSTQRKALQPLCGISLAMLSAIESRLDDAHAIDTGRAAIARCPTCRFVPRAARALAAAGAIDESLSVLEPLIRTRAAPDAAATRVQVLDCSRWRQLAAQSTGPTRVHAEAQAYLAIGMFGSAYRLLAPHRRDFESLFDVSSDFARIAAYAGDDRAARETLLNHMNPQDADARLDRWKAERQAAKDPSLALF